MRYEGKTEPDAEKNSFRPCGHFPRFYLGRQQNLSAAIFPGSINSFEPMDNTEGIYGFQRTTLPDLLRNIFIHLFPEPQRVLHKRRADVQKLLPRRQKDGDHVPVHIHIDVIELRLVVVIGAVADAADVKLCAFALQQVDGQPVIREHAHVFIGGEHLFQHGKARLFRKERALVRIDENGDDHLVEQLQAL